MSAVTVADIPESNGKGKAIIGDKENTVTKHENLVLKVYGEIRQDLGDG
ncbi:TPA: hypothetical protein ACFPDI_000607 [Neisseria meningitidis]